MPTIIHASIRVTGPKHQRDSFRQRVLDLLAEDPADTEIEERHTDDVLCYDLKCGAGIPFPPFVLASAEYPDVEVLAEWVDPTASVAGSARIRAGALAEQHTRRTGAPAASGLYIELADSGRLTLALNCIETATDEYAGYVATAASDALFRVVRALDSGVGELLATTSGEPAWRARWRLDFAAGTCEYEDISPQAIPEALRGALEAAADSLSAEWLWFAPAPAEDTIFERERYAERGLEVSPVNLKSERLDAIHETGLRGRRVLDHLGPRLDWLKEVMRECWAETVSG
jgi:hypothetical protein